MPAEITPAIDFRATVAPVFFGGLFSWCLFGVLCTQFYTYYRTSYQKDRPLIRGIVHTLLISEIIFTGCATYYMYSLVISAWLDISSLSRIPWSVSLITPGTAFIALLVHLLFARRIWMYGLGSIISRCISALVVVITLLQFSASISFSVTWATKFDFGFALVRVEPMLQCQTSIWLLGCFANDVLIAGTMVTMLIRSKQENPVIFSTAQTLDRLVLRAIETGVVTTIVALIELILYLHPGMLANSYYATPYFCLAKFYSTMLMANLNSRDAIAKTLHPSSMIELRTIPNDRCRGIFVSTTTERTVDPRAFSVTEWQKGA